MGKKKKKHSKEGRRNTSKGGNRIIPSKRAQSHPLAWHARTVSCILVQCSVECFTSTDNTIPWRRELSRRLQLLFYALQSPAATVSYY
jgi:hypothetical protein